MSQLTIFGTVEDAVVTTPREDGRQLALDMPRVIEPRDLTLVPGLFGDLVAEAGDETWARETAAFASKPRQSLEAFKREWRERMLGMPRRPPRERTEAQKNRALRIGIRAANTRRITRAGRS